MRNGPLLLRGDVRVFDDDDNLLYEGERAALCRCGGSSNKPFCDGTHKTNGFQG
jgi:CDGSH-type Zn-finger protein